MDEMSFLNIEGKDYELVDEKARKYILEFSKTNQIEIPVKDFSDGIIMCFVDLIGNFCNTFSISQGNFQWGITLGNVQNWNAVQYQQAISVTLNNGKLIISSNDSKYTLSGTVFYRTY